MRSAIRIAAALTVVAIVCSTAGSASARVLQRFGTTGQDRLRLPQRIVYGADGLLHVVDTGDAARDPVFVRLFTPEGAPAGGFRVAAGHDGFIPAMAVDGAGDTYVPVPGAVLKYSLAGALLARIPVQALDNGDPGLAVELGVDPAGRLVAFDGQARRFDTFTPDGRLVASFSPPATALRALDSDFSVGASGIAYVGERDGITVLDSSGAVVRRLPRPAPLAPRAGYVDGPGGTVFAVAGHRIQKLGPDGAYLGAVATERTAAAPNAAVGPDGSIYVTSWHSLSHVPDGAVLKLAPITTVDLTPPMVAVRSFTSSPLPRRLGPRTTLTLGRMVLTVSEAAAYRVSVKRRATTQNRRRPEFGRYIHLATVDVPHIAPGAHRLVLDWRTFGYGQRIPRPGRYQLAFVATDDSGNESRPARVTFTVRRS